MPQAAQDDRASARSPSELDLPGAGRRADRARRPRRPSRRRRRASAAAQAAPRAQAAQRAPRGAGADQGAPVRATRSGPNAAARRRRGADLERTGEIAALDLQALLHAGLRPRPQGRRLKRLQASGSRVVAGTILGRIGRLERARPPHVLFEIRPAGRGAPRIDPKPILDGWKLLESTAIYRAAGTNPFFGPDAENPSIGQILLMSKEALAAARARRPAHRGLRLRPPRHPHGPDRPPRARHARVPRRLRPQARRSPRCSAATATSRRSGNVSEHSSGNAVDIAAINGIPIPGHQGAGSITELTIQRLLTLQGTMKPHQIISPDDVRRRRQHARDGRPRRPHPRRAGSRCTARTRRRPSRSTRSSSPSSGSS